MPDDVQGILMRSVDDLVKAMGMTGISKSQVSRLCGEIDEKVQGFAQDHAQAASTQWRGIADQLCPRIPKLATLME